MCPSVSGVAQCSTQESQMVVLILKGELSRTSPRILLPSPLEPARSDPEPTISPSRGLQTCLTAPSCSGRLFGQFQQCADAQDGDVADTSSVVPHTLASSTPMGCLPLRDVLPSCKVDFPKPAHRRGVASRSEPYCRCVTGSDETYGVCGVVLAHLESCSTLACLVADRSGALVRQRVPA